MLLGAIEQQNDPKRKNEPTKLVEQLVRSSPLFLSSGRPETQGWVFERMVDGLIAQDKAKEALGWAKLGYMMAPFESGAMEKATRLITKAWTADDDYQAIAAFGKAQSDASPEARAANPLSKIALPQVVDEMQPQIRALAEKLAADAKVETDRLRERDLVGLYILQKQWLGAMKQAQRLLRENIESADGAREVARVLKANDLSTARSNAFIALLQGKGEGKNPVKEFQQEHAAK